MDTDVFLSIHRNCNVRLHFQRTVSIQMKFTPSVANFTLENILNNGPMRSRNADSIQRKSPVVDTRD